MQKLLARHYPKAESNTPDIVISWLRSGNIFSHFANTFLLIPIMFFSFIYPQFLSHPHLVTILSLFIFIFIISLSPHTYLYLPHSIFGLKPQDSLTMVWLDRVEFCSIVLRFLLDIRKYLYTLIPSRLAKSKRFIPLDTDWCIWECTVPGASAPTTRGKCIEGW